MRSIKKEMGFKSVLAYCSTCLVPQMMAMNPLRPWAEELVEKYREGSRGVLLRFAPWKQSDASDRQVHPSVSMA